MSVLTEVLKLFKYDPATDGDMTFNIGQCMNDNWDKLDAAILLAIAAAGAYNPEESYAVGDYCTYKGKLHKCSTAIPTGETWTETHWTTTTVAAELAELSSQLSNKVDNGSNGIPGDDCNNLENFGLYRVQTTTANCPVPASLGDTLINAPWDKNAILQLFFGVSVGKIFWRRRTYISENPWSNWFPLANATPPQEFALPLAEGLQPVPAYGSNKYRKNQFNEVGITISVTKTDIATNDIENTSLLATLPAGFRPATLVSGAAFVDRGEESVVYPAFIAIHPDGSVRINQSNAVSCSMVVASISFVAAT